MPWTEELPNGRYRAVWRDQLGRQRSRSGFAQEAAAKRYAGEQEGNTRRGEPSYVGRSVTWGQWLPQWLALRVIERSSAESDTARIGKWLGPAWEKRQLAKITREDVQRWVNELAKQMAPSSVEKTYRLFSASMRAAVAAGHLPVSPCRDIALPVVPPSDERFFTRPEVDLALHHMIEPYRTAVIVLVGTGCRFGEVAGLHRNRIDWDAEAIDIVETWDGAIIKPYPKGRKKRRVPLPSWVAEAIAALPNEAETSCGLPHKLHSPRCQAGLVITGPHGAPLNARNMLRRHWTPALQRAGLLHARQHDLRHTYASWMVQAGLSMAQIAELLGHSETSVTARYAHMAETHIADARRVLEGLRPVGAPLMPHKGGPVLVG